jgi:hypothetical protein
MFSPSRLVADWILGPVGENTSNAPIYGFMILVGAGAGCYIVAGFAIVQSLVPGGDTANAVGAMTICECARLVRT